MKPTPDKRQALIFDQARLITQAVNLNDPNPERFNQPVHHDSPYPPARLAASPPHV